MESEETVPSIIRGYFNYHKAINLKKHLAMDIPDGFVMDADPQQFLIDFHGKRLAYYEDRRFLFYDHKERMAKEGTMICRGMPAYQARTGDTFDDLADYIVANNLPTVLSTFALRTPEGTSPLDTLVDTQGLVNRLISYIATTNVHRAAAAYRAALERKGVQKEIIKERIKSKMPGWWRKFRLEYVWGIEPTKRGYAHLHILFIGANYIIPKEDLDRWWRKNGLGDSPGIDIQEVKGQRDYGRQMSPDEASRLAVHYVTDYINKPSNDPRWSALLTLMRRREWGMSNTLRGKIRTWRESKKDTAQDEGGSAWSLGTSNSNIEDRYELIGIYSKSELDLLLTDRSLPPDEIRALLGEIEGAKRNWESGKWRRGESS